MTWCCNISIRVFKKFKFFYFKLVFYMYFWIVLLCADIKINFLKNIILMNF